MTISLFDGVSFAVDKIVDQSQRGRFLGRFNNLRSGYNVGEINELSESEDESLI